MANDTKDTIYIDIDDEITAIIDKLRASNGKVVALVLPKRASMLQSIVNMKLLKRAAEESKKNVVLITTESGLLPLAGAVGLHVAKTPNSRPEIPAGPAEEPAEEQVDEVDLDDGLPITAETAGNQPIGDLAAAAGASGAATMPLPSKPKPEDSSIETLEIDNAAPESTKSAAFAAAAAAAAKKPKLPKDKRLAVPNFDRFRVLLVLGALLLVVLIVGGYFAFAVLPKATINIKTNASNVNTNVDFKLSTSASMLSESSRTVPAKQAQVQKTYTGTANASGQQNNGDKASGTVTMTAQECAPSIGSPSVPAGSGISSGGMTYITQEVAKFDLINGHGSCVTYKTTNPVSIKAQNGGAKYNLDSNATFTVASHSDITATGTADGGTDDIQTVVSQADIDSAKGKINADASSVQDNLKNQLSGQGLYAIAATYNAGDPQTSNSAQAGDAASSVTVTEVITYTMLGVNQDDLNKLIDNNIKSQIDTSKQGILSRGITQAAFKLGQFTSDGASMNVQTTAEVGPSIDTATIAANAAGQKAGDIKASIKADPDVTDVDVKLSPFWVSKAPKKVSKITVNVAKPTAANAN